MPEQKPTVGRIVHFHTRGSADGVYPPTNFAGIITEVASDTQVSIAVFGKAGLRFEQDVHFGEEPGQWSWPPRV